MPYREDPSGGFASRAAPHSASVSAPLYLNEMPSVHLGNGVAPQWSADLVAATRRQFAGCIMAIEQALSEGLAHGAGDAFAGDALRGVASTGISRMPEASFAELLAHFRVRASFATIDADAMGGATTLSSFAYEASDDALKIALALGRWRALNAGEALPADLPAELYHDLLWRVAAVMADALAQRLGGEPTRIHALVDDVAQILAYSHDESETPFALAGALALRMRDEVDRSLLLRLARDRQFLILLSICSDRVGVPFDLLASEVVHGDCAAVLAALALAGDIPADAMAECAAALVNVRPDIGLAAPGHCMELIAGQSADWAQAMLAPMRLSQPMRAQLAALREARR